MPRQLTLCVLVDKYSVIVDMYKGDLNVVLGLHTTYKVEKLTSGYLFSVSDVDPAMAAVVISIDDPVLLTVDTLGSHRSDDIDMNAMEKVR